MDFYRNPLQHPDLEIINGTILLTHLRSVQLAERKHVRKHTVNMETKYVLRLSLTLLLIMLTLSLLQHWTGANNPKDGIVVMLVASIWPVYYYSKWMSIRRGAVQQFRDCHPNYKAVVT